MNRKITPYIYILFFSFFLSEIHSQKENAFHLEIKSSIPSENDVIKSINYQKKFIKISNLNRTKDSVLSILKEKGFYTLLIDEFNQQENKLTYFLKLRVKIKEAHIKVKPKDQPHLERLNLKSNKNYLIIEIAELKSTLNSISNYLIENGQLFSKVSITKSKIENQILFSELEIQNTKKRSINKTIIKGYDDFPTSFVNHYLNLNKKHTLNEKKINEVSSKINRLNFVSEIKKPEILFSKDSTLLYIYLKKKQSNRFDGLINFTSENNKLKFRGYLDLNLVNIFNKGEEISVNWKNNSNNIQDFTFIAKNPYIFNSKISSEVSFNLFRNDSIYTNSRSEISLKYPINKFISYSLSYKSENSSSNSNTNNIKKFNKNMIGFGAHYNSLKNNQFQFDFNLFYGTRKTDIKTNQYLASFNTSRLIKVSERIMFYIKNKSAFLFSDDYLENELFREGGINSVRGFNEQSILASKFSYFNSEFRFLSKNKSYLYSIHDFGMLNFNTKNNTFYTLGIGYLLTRKNNSVNISYTQGNTTNQITSSKSAILSIKIFTDF